MIKTFRGLLESGGQRTIRLSTNNGMTGYRILKLQAITKAPGATTAESVVKLYTVEQSAIDGEVDFDDSRLLGVVYWTGRSSAAGSKTIIFDNIVFNQDIFVTAKELDGSDRDTNYYLELEQISLDLSEATVATLKDMRGSN